MGDDAIRADELENLLRGAPPPARDDRYGLAVERREGCLVIRPHGILMQSEPTEFENRLIDLVGEHSARNSIIDLAKVHYMSSAVLGCLVGYLHRVKTQRGQVVLVRPPDKVLRMIEILGLTQIFLVIDDLETAIAYYRVNPSPEDPPP
jgi:anti-anti-sigma factor